MMPSKAKGFTLVELIAVIAIIIVVMAFVVPSMTGILHGNGLTSASQMLVDRLSLARQYAISTNRKVEVRFYKYANSQVPGSLNSFRAIQSFEMITASNLSALDKVQALPTGVIIDSGATLSSLMVPPFTTGTSSIPHASSYTYVAFHFLPNGSTDLLPTSDWFLTLHDENKQDNLTKPPTNFITIDIDPVGGTLKTFQPGI